MKNKYRGKVTRTSGWSSQPEFDNELKDYHISDLVFLNHKYHIEIRDFPNHFDLNDEGSQQLYKEMLQRKSMIGEELKHRMMDINASPSFQEQGSYYDSETGLVINRTGDIEYSISFSEDEDYIICPEIGNSMESLESLDDETDYHYYKYHDKIELYREWDYIKDLDE